MNAFLDELFPLVPAFGFQSKPRYIVVVPEFADGGEGQRIRLSSRPLFNFEVDVGTRLNVDVERVITLWHAAGGKECGFLIEDKTDFKSCSARSSVSALDQPLVQASSDEFQLVKDYTFGTRTQRREIYKPKTGTVIVANQSGVTQAPSTYTVDTTLGLVTPGMGFSGIPTTAGFEFYVPVRFDNEELPITISDRNGDDGFVLGTAFLLKELKKNELGF